MLGVCRHTSAARCRGCRQHAEQQCRRSGALPLTTCCPRIPPTPQTCRTGSRSARSCPPGSGAGPAGVPRTVSSACSSQGGGGLPAVGTRCCARALPAHGVGSRRRGPQQRLRGLVQHAHPSLAPKLACGTLLRSPGCSHSPAPAEAARWGAGGGGVSHGSLAGTGGPTCGITWPPAVRAQGAAAYPTHWGVRSLDKRPSCRDDRHRWRWHGPGGSAPGSRLPCSTNAQVRRP